MPKCPVCKFETAKPCLLHEPNSSACQKRVRRRRRQNSLASEDLEHRRKQRQMSRGLLEVVDRKTALRNSIVALTVHRLALHHANHRLEPSGKRFGLYYYRNVESYYDEPIIRAVTQYSSMLDKLLVNDVVLDVGSNVGVFSIEAALRGAKVTAFEPCHDHVVIAKQHALLNNVSRMVVTKEAAVVGNQHATTHVKLYL